VTADFEIAGIAAGENLAGKFAVKSPGVWELKLEKPVTDLERSVLTVAVKDRQGNLQKLERTFRVK
jgi:hypothetical protein